MKYISADGGKYNTKLNAFCKETGKIQRTKFRTKLSEGTFDDDMFEKGTFIVQVDGGNVYKVGRDAKKEPDVETSKKSEIHKVCILTATALACGEGRTEDANIVIGIPLQVCNIPEERIAYKDYILGKPGEKHLVKIKTSPNGNPVECEFSFGKRLVYPEGIGVLYEYPSRLSGPTGIIDIGNVNTNNLYCDQFMINTDGCFTDEMGGKVLISGLAATLTSELGARVDDNLAASVLCKPYEKRFLTSTKGNKAMAEKSREIIDAYMLEHVQKIRQRCDTRHWPMEFMSLVCMGGTAKLLAHEIKIVFGKETFIPEDPEYVNACGFLKKMCADDGIEIGKTGGA